MTTCWGIFREPEHSPDREADDAEILRLTGKHLETKGFGVTLKTPEEMLEATDAPGGVFLMCERLPALRRLQAWDASGIPHVNRPLGVLNTYRERMLAQFEEADVATVPSRIVTTEEPPGETPRPVWVKRADVHNTRDGDVVFAPSAAAVRAALAGLAARGIPRAVIQPHVEGDLVKFYGIGPGRGPAGGPPWFRWFHHAGQEAAGHPVDPPRLARLARRAAAALGLEIYGGDMIVTPGGGLVLLDLNAWPSFARYREEAALAIAAYLALRFPGGAR